MLQAMLECFMKGNKTMKKKIIGLFLVFVMIVSAFTACSPSVKSLVQKADEALKATPYKLEASVDFNDKDK